MLNSKQPLAAGFSASVFLFAACSDQPTDTPEAPSAPQTVAKPDFPEAPDAAVQYVAGQLAAGKAGVLWQAMPPVIGPTSMA